MHERTKTYFLSDAHLGSRTIPNVKAHELKLVQWLEMASSDAARIFLMGDMFDFWFEYRRTVPKGFVRFLGKLAELSDRGIEIHLFVGNHDLWTFGYLEQEIGIIVHRQPETLEIDGKRFFLAHGDGLNDKSKKFSFIRSVFHNSACQWLFRCCIPSSWGLYLGYVWSESNRRKHLRNNVGYLGENKELLVMFAKKYSAEHPDIDYFVFGHRHILLHLQFNSTTQMVILGDFMYEFSYAVFCGKQFEIHHFECL